MEVEYIKGLGCPVNIIWGKEATAITITDAKQLQAKLAQVIEQEENEPGPELSKFEKRIRFTIDEVVDGRYNADNIEDVKGIAKGLLELAREQFIKDGYVIEKKAFHDAVEKVAPEVMKEVFDKVDIEEALRLEYEKGRTDALKDLPRWRVSNAMRSTLPTVMYGNNGMILYKDGLEVSISDLEKLPGFNK